jgi:peptidoglycan/LPS O-acetylase OafA/YrhL
MLYRNFDFASGVDLFLVISGFVIARGLLPMLAATHGTVEFFNVALSFWVRRAWRLLPSAWLWLGVILIIAPVFNESGAFQSVQSNIESVVAAVLNIANLRTAYIFGHFDGGTAFPYWSLSLEEQFYAILPFVVFFAGRRLTPLLVVIIVAQLFLYRIGPGGNTLFNMIKSDGLCLGVLLAIWAGSPSYFRVEPTVLKHKLFRMTLAPAFLVVFAALTGPVFGPKYLLAGMAAILGAVIVWVASYNRDYLFAPGRIKQSLCWLGARSYAIYLIHIPVYRANHEIWFRLHPAIFNPSFAHGAALVLTSCCLLFPLVELNYRFVELPLRKRGARIATRIRKRDLSALTGVAGESFA